MGRSSGGCCSGTAGSPGALTGRDGVLGDMWDMGTHREHGGLTGGSMGVSIGVSVWRGLCGESMWGHYGVSGFLSLRSQLFPVWPHLPSA